MQLEGFRELQGERSWWLLVGLKSPGLRNSSFPVYYVLLLYVRKHVLTMAQQTCILQGNILRIVKTIH